MAYDLKKEEEVKEFITKLGIEYRFGCYSEKKADVCHLLGDYLEAVKKDESKARKVYQTNCEDRDFGRSCHKSGTYAFRAADPNGALTFFEKACGLGVAESCLNAGLIHVNSKAKETVREKGLDLLKKGCDGNNHHSCFYLSGIHLHEKNMPEARQFSERACSLGNMYACANLSQMYRKGDGGEKSEEKADLYKARALELQDEVKKQQGVTFQEGIKPV
ncbi:cytochrome c oxidase assembly factor 7 homolog [Neocloeon triangulifer]|uniref:cytochrome c oxidase assembly factor 7 homolog n=1 Tax=Neocloeon triangulifer TaxID=2078957 RepID=UPI00286EEDD7|nr:cytochrome c oxidase assembly factor 7 homolog [Neocloeon triangulifer]